MTAPAPPPAPIHTPRLSATATGIHPFSAPDPLRPLSPNTVITPVILLHPVSKPSVATVVAIPTTSTTPIRVARTSSKPF